MNTNEMGNDPIPVNPGTVIHNNLDVTVYLLIRQDNIDMHRSQTLQPGQNYTIQWIQLPPNPQDTGLTVQKQTMPN